MPRIYLDNNATTAIDREVLSAMIACWTGESANASSLHREGQIARRTLETARESVAERLDAQPAQVIFTAGGTEANNLAIFGLAGDPPAHIITTTVEHPSVLGCVDKLESRGFQISRLPVDTCGRVNVDELAATFRPDTRLVTIMLANNEVGTIQPIDALASACRERRVPFHVDAVQAVGRIPVSFRSLGVTSLSLSAHKFHGPIGVGALVVDNKDLLARVLAGGHQEGGVRPGTEPIALAVGLAKALETASANIQADGTRIRELASLFWDIARSQIPGVELNTPTSDQLPNTVNLRKAGLDAQAAVMSLDLLGVSCSTGSACASGAATPSHVLLAMGQSDAQARSAIRFSLSRHTTRAEIEQASLLVARVLLSSKAVTTNVAPGSGF